MKRNWQKDLRKYQTFLQSLNLEKYSHLRAIKTVEQDLPNKLLPLEIYYRYYWDTTEFKDYQDIFKIYWREKFSPYIYDFIRKYFYGCAIEFIEKGFKARLYRTWMSILTQFHFQYLWNSLFSEKLESTPRLDKIGIDARAVIRKKTVGFHIAKISYRREASKREFTEKQQKEVNIIVEVPYLVIDLKDLEDKIKSKRTHEETKDKALTSLQIFNEKFVRYDNGFVIFAEGYLKQLHKIITRKVSMIGEGKISYNENLTW